MKVLVACEFSGIVREAFKKRGHYTWSCDLLETEILGNHYQGNVFDIINEGWDLMIDFPPCTYLSNVGMCNKTKNYKRVYDTLKAADFFMDLWFAQIGKICIENPAGIMSTIFRKPDQYIQPYFFGDNQIKRTGLWLKNLPLLHYEEEDNLFYERTATEKPKESYVRKGGLRKGMKEYFVNSNNPKKDRWKFRSRTFQGLANAMANQWG